MGSVETAAVASTDLGAGMQDGDDRASVFIDDDSQAIEVFTDAGRDLVAQRLESLATDGQRPAAAPDERVAIRVCAHQVDVGFRHAAGLCLVYGVLGPIEKGVWGRHRPDLGLERAKVRPQPKTRIPDPDSYTLRKLFLPTTVAGMLLVSRLAEVQVAPCARKLPHLPAQFDGLVGVEA